MFAILLLAHGIEELAGVGEAFHLQAAVFELVGQRLARQLVAFQHSHAAALEGGTWQVFGVVAGAFGMNLPVPLRSDSGAFSEVLIVSAAACSALFLGVLLYLKSQRLLQT